MPILTGDLATVSASGNQCQAKPGLGKVRVAGYDQIDWAATLASADTIGYSVDLKMKTGEKFVEIEHRGPEANGSYEMDDATGYYDVSTVDLELPGHDAVRTASIAELRAKPCLVFLCTGENGDTIMGGAEHFPNGFEPAYQAGRLSGHVHAFGSVTDRVEGKANDVIAFAARHKDVPLHIAAATDLDAITV